MQMMRIRWIFLVTFIVSAAIVFWGLSSALNDQSSERESEMMELVLEWGQLAPIPDNVENFSISSEGNAFTRSIRVNFTSTEEDIQAWINASPGLLDASIEETNDGKQKYIIEPGGGANYAEVIIDFDLNMVIIYVSWS